MGSQDLAPSGGLNEPVDPALRLVAIFTQRIDTLHPTRRGFASVGRGA